MFLLYWFLFLDDFISPIEDKVIPMRPQGNRLIKNRPQNTAPVLPTVIPSIINIPKEITGSRYIIKEKKYILYIFIRNKFV
jgi:hypothetical protein